MNIPETYNQLDQWTTVMFLYNSALKAINTKIEILNNEFIHLYNYNPIEHIKSRKHRRVSSRSLNAVDMR